LEQLAGVYTPSHVNNPLNDSFVLKRLSLVKFAAQREANRRTKMRRARSFAAPCMVRGDGRCHLLLPVEHPKTAYDPRVNVFFYLTQDYANHPEVCQEIFALKAST
jgi:hypothetical protein